MHGLKRKHFPYRWKNILPQRWANIEKTKPVSKVPMPSEIDVELAHEWVEETKIGRKLYSKPEIVYYIPVKNCKGV